MTDMVDKLINYASGKISDADAQEVEALLTQYLDGDLAPKSAAEIERALDKDHALAAIVADARLGRRWIKETLAPEFQTALTRSASPELVSFVDDLVISGSKRDDHPSDVLSSRREFQAWPRKAYALAASAAALLIFSGWSFYSSIRGQLEEAHAVQAQLKQEIEQRIVDQETKAGEVAALEQQLEQQGRKVSWAIKVAEYHSLYARQSERHLVEVPANQRDHIEKWLGEQLGRSLMIPDLSDADMVFKGARLLAIEGKPVAQLMYIDSDGEPLGFCFMRNMTGEVKAPELNRHDTLKLIDWSDKEYKYAVVGATTFATLEAVAHGLNES